jgi:carbonic anhydrase
MIRYIIWIISVILLIALTPRQLRSAEHVSDVTPDDALNRLVEGNQRYQADALKYQHVNQDRRCDTFKDQHPIASVLACADSRSPVELVFDQGIGDLFVVRVAGNVSANDEIGSIEYAVGHLNTPLVVVLGHSKCGAVTAVVQKAPVHGHIAELVHNIIPAAADAAKKNPDLQGAALIEETVKANVLQSIKDLIVGSEEVRERVKAGQLKIVGGVYDLHSGGVHWLGAHPEQDKLLGSESPAIGGKSEHKPAAQTKHESKPTPAHEEKPAALHETKPPAEATGHESKPASKSEHGPVSTTAKPAHGDAHGDAHATEKKPAAASHEHAAEASSQHAPAATGKHAEASEKEETLAPHAPAEKPHNYIALGGLMLGAAALSTVVFHFMKRPTTAATPASASAEVAEVPAAAPAAHA